MQPNLPSAAFESMPVPDAIDPDTNMQAREKAINPNRMYL